MFASGWYLWSCLRNILSIIFIFYLFHFEIVVLSELIIRKIYCKSNTAAGNKTKKYFPYTEYWWSSWQHKTGTMHYNKGNGKLYTIFSAEFQWSLIAEWFRGCNQRCIMRIECVSKWHKNHCKGSCSFGV